MRLDWMTRPMRSLSVDELEARGRYGEAAARLREELASRTPSLADRLRLADLLVHAGRTAEAVPILLGIADEWARYGFRDQALEALRRAEAAAPGHSGLRERFEALARSKARPLVAGRRVKGAA